MWRVGVLLWAALIGGCVTATLPARKVDLAGTCAPRIEDLPRIPLLFPRLVDGKPAKPEGFREYADWARCVQSDTARIPAALFELRDVTLPAQMTIALQAGGNGTLAAAVSLLDAGMHPVRRYAFDRFVQRSGTYTLDVFLNPDDATVRYVLITPDTVGVGRSDTRYTTNSTMIGVPAGAGLFFFTAYSEGRVVNSFGDAGRLMIGVKPTSVR